MSQQQNWQALVWQQYGDNLRAMLRAKIGNHADAEDLLQDILIKSYQQLPNLKDQAKLKPWLTSVARNAIIDHYRHNGRQPDLSKESLWYEADEASILDELSQCIRPFIDALPAETAALIKAVDLQGASQKQLAVQQGLSYSGLKSRVQRGRQQLRQLYQECCQMELDHRGQPMDCAPNNGCGCD